MPAERNRLTRATQLVAEGSDFREDTSTFDPYERALRMGVAPCGSGGEEDPAGGARRSREGDGGIQKVRFRPLR